MSTSSNSPAFLARFSQSLLDTAPDFESDLLDLPPEPLVRLFLESARTLLKSSPLPPDVIPAEAGIVIPAEAGTPGITQPSFLENCLLNVFSAFQESLNDLPPFQFVLYYLQTARIPQLLPPLSPLRDLLENHLDQYFDYFLFQLDSLQPQDRNAFRLQLLRIAQPKSNSKPGRPPKNNTPPPPPPPPDTPAPPLSPSTPAPPPVIPA
ncbi:MAG: hypothetical protein LBU08_01015, partial [Tannerellaceae bacterium]|nr:hypothetical protein [Tannerellaceae bacterium]